MKPKVSWELLDRGSLRLRIISGDRDVSWTIGKTADLDRVYNVLEEMQVEINRSRTLPRDEHYLPKDDAYYAEMARIAVDDIPLYVAPDEAEKASKAALAEKANSFKLENGMFWGANDMDDLELYELGTGDPE